MQPLTFTCSFEMDLDWDHLVEPTITYQDSTGRSLFVEIKDTVQSYVARTVKTRPFTNLHDLNKELELFINNLPGKAEEYTWWSSRFVITNNLGFSGEVGYDIDENMISGLLSLTGIEHDKVQLETILDLICKH